MNTEMARYEIKAELLDKIIDKQDGYIKHLKLQLKMKNPAKGTTSELYESELVSLRSQLQDKEPERTTKNHDSEIKELLRKGFRLGAIKLHYGMTGQKGLKESKIYCDKLYMIMKSNGEI